MWWDLVITVSVIDTTHSVISGNVMNHAERREQNSKGLSDPCSKSKLYLSHIFVEAFFYLLLPIYAGNWVVTKRQKNNKLIYSLWKLIEVSNVYEFREQCNQYKRYRAYSLYWHKVLWCIVVYLQHTGKLLLTWNSPLKPMRWDQTLLSYELQRTPS